MNESTELTHTGFAVCVEDIEAAYEFMLAYAAQGRDREPTGSTPSIRGMLQNLAHGLQQLPAAAKAQLDELSTSTDAGVALSEFLQQLGEDARRALKAVHLVQTAPVLSSQLIDNLNASAHLRCVLTDIFVLDEAMQQHGVAAAQSSSPIS